MDYNGGSVVAMVGKDCVAIASDLRLGNQALGVASNFQKVRAPCPFVPASSISSHLLIDISNYGPYLSWPSWPCDRRHDTVRYDTLSALLYQDLTCAFPLPSLMALTGTINSDCV
jgi:hypothetical protein